MLRAKRVPVIINGEKVGKALVRATGAIEILEMQEQCPAGKQLLAAIHNRQVLGVVITLGGDES
jgi:hypothetical protein